MRDEERKGRNRRGKRQCGRQWDEREAESVNSFSNLYPGETLGPLRMG